MICRQKLELESSHGYQVPPLGRDHVFIEGLPLLLRHLQPVPQLLDLLSVTLARRLVLCLTFLQLWDQKNTTFQWSCLPSFLITIGAGWHGQKVRLTWQMSSFRDVIFSLERQKESSSSHTTSFSKLVSGMWSSSSMCNIICFFRAMNSACRLAWKHKWLIW